MPTVAVEKPVKDSLDRIKIHERETYGDVIIRLIKEHNEKERKP
jgi:predicted CopG family antitoxin